MTYKITGQQLNTIVPSLTDTRAQDLAEMFTQAFANFGVTTARQAAAIIAQCAHESMNFKKKEEILSHTAKRLREVWPARFPTSEIANKYANRPEALANYVYAHRMGNGSEASGDGYANRGGGYIMLTGFDMYVKYAREKKVDVKTIRELVRTKGLFAVDSAVWLFVKEKKLLDEADAGKIDTISERINGGNIGKKERREMYQLALSVLK